MEKPGRMEVGSRWKNRSSGNVWEVVSRDYRGINMVSQLGVSGLGADSDIGTDCDFAGWAPGYGPSKTEGATPEAMQVAQHQRWKPRHSRWSGPSFVIDGPNAPSYGWPVKWDESGGGGHWKSKDILGECTFLGYADGYGPQPPTPRPLSTPVPAKGQRWRWTKRGDSQERTMTIGDQIRTTSDGRPVLAIKYADGRDDQFTAECIAQAAVYVDCSTSTRAPGAEATVWEHSSNGLFWRECQKTSDVCGHRFTRRKGEAGASGGGDGILPKTRRDNKAPAAVSPLTAFQIIQLMELEKANARAETAAVLAEFVDYVDLLPDVSP